MKRRLSAILILILVLVSALAVQVSAADMSRTNEESGYVALIEDDAGLIKDMDAVMESMMPVTEYGNVCLKTVDENPYTASTFAEKYLHENFGTTSSTVFLIDMDNRKVYIFSDGAIYKTITKSKANVITDNIYTYASAGDYDRCAIKSFEQMSTLLSGNRIAEPMHIIGIALISLLLGMIICFVIMWKSTRKAPVSDRELIRGTDTKVSITEPVVKFAGTTKVYSPPSSSDGGSSGGGYSGGSSGGGGGGGGGGSSGGGGGHSF